MGKKGGGKSGSVRLIRVVTVVGIWGAMLWGTSAIRGGDASGLLYLVGQEPETFSCPSLGASVVEIHFPGFLIPPSGHHGTQSPRADDWNLQ